MTCEVCSQWAAKTERQWKNRMANMRSPDVEIAPCYICGGKEWATIKPPPERKHWKTTRWNTIVWGVTLLIATTTVVYGVLDGDGWAVVAGIAVAVAGLLLTQQGGGE